MTKLPVLVVASALLITACSAAATHAISKAQPATIPGVRVNAGPNANADISDITNRPNPPAHPGGSTQIRPPAPQNSAAAGAPSFRPGADRCSGIGTDLASSRVGSSKRPPLPMCAAQ